MNEPFPDEIADAAWDEAHRRADAIRRFLRDRPDSRSVSDVLDLARELGVSKATAYRLVRAFRAGGTVMAKPLRSCSTVAPLSRIAGPILRSQLLGWRVTCPSCGEFLLDPDGSEVASPFLSRNQSGSQFRWSPKCPQTI